MKKTRRLTSVITRKKDRWSKKHENSGVRVNARYGKILSQYNGVLVALYQKDIKETTAAITVLAETDVATLKAKYARFEKKLTPVTAIDNF